MWLLISDENINTGSHHKFRVYGARTILGVFHASRRITDEREPSVTPIPIIAL